MFGDRITPELQAAMEAYEKRFGDIVPLEMVGGTTEELLRNIQRCLDEDKDLLPEIYEWDFKNGTVY